MVTSFLNPGGSRKHAVQITSLTSRSPINPKSEAPPAHLSYLSPGWAWSDASGASEWVQLVELTERAINTVSIRIASSTCSDITSFVRLDITASEVGP